MNERVTQALLAAVVALLAVRFCGPPATAAAVQAEGAEPVPAVLRARMIELVDDRGQVRANLKVEPGGEAVFRLRDAQGTIRVKLGASEDGAGLLLLDHQTEPGEQLLAKRTGTSLTLAEKGKEQRVITP